LTLAGDGALHAQAPVARSIVSEMTSCPTASYELAAEHLGERIGAQRRVSMALTVELRPGRCLLDERHHGGRL
jgi:hypothetical protein